MVHRGEVYLTQQSRSDIKGRHLRAESWKVSRSLPDREGKESHSGQREPAYAMTQKLKIHVLLGER